MLNRVLRVCPTEQLISPNMKDTRAYTLTPSPLTNRHPLIRARSTSMAPFISMELNECERAVVLAMRDAVKAEVAVITEHLQQANNFRYDLINTNRYLQAENMELTRALNEHDIEVPGPSSDHYAGTPSVCSDN